MNEASKTNAIRSKDFFKNYLSGRVVDIGAGDDPVIPGVEIFDLAQGDANQILNHLTPNAYDAVHASHCLEHMNDPFRAVSDWYALLRPGGYLILVVPEETLYEQMIWPSAFNSDHKHTFRYKIPHSWSPVSVDVLNLLDHLPGVQVISIELQDTGYRYDLQNKQVNNTKRLFWAVKKFFLFVGRIKFYGRFLQWSMEVILTCPGIFGPS